MEYSDSTYSYAATSDLVPVILVRRVDLPTDGKPMRPTRASPDLVTSNPSPGLAPPPPPFGARISRRNFASFAFNIPIWKLVALFFCVRSTAHDSDTAHDTAPHRNHQRKKNLLRVQPTPPLTLFFDFGDLLQRCHPWPTARYEHTGNTTSFSACVTQRRKKNFLDKVVTNHSFAKFACDVIRSRNFALT